VRDEIRQFITCDEDLTDQNLKKMRYFDNVIQETLRVYPPVPSTSRHAIKDDTLPNGMKLKAGTTLIYSALFLHTNPKYWDNPSKFDPDRWNGLGIPTLRTSNADRLRTETSLPIHTVSCWTHAMSWTSHGID